MARLTVADLQQMKRDGKKIAAGVVYEVQMARIFERAGADVLSVGDSVGRTFLGHETTDEITMVEMVIFARAVSRVAERAVVSTDLPTAVCNAGATEVSKAAVLLKKETTVDMVKADIRTREEELLDEVRAVIDAGLAAYPQIGFLTAQGVRAAADPSLLGRHSSPEDREYVLKWAHAVEDAGAAMLDLTQVSREIYADVVNELRIPVIGGSAPPEADGKIYVSAGLVGYRADLIDSDDGRPRAAKLIYDIVKEAVDNVHAGKWEQSAPRPIG